MRGLATICVLFGLIESVQSLNIEQKLIAKLFDENHYDRRVRPVENSRLPVEVSFRLDFNQLYDVSEKTQTITILTDVYEQWYDPRLFWDKTQYENVTSFTIDSTAIWTPDTTLYNGVEMYRPSVEDIGKAIITTIPESNTSLINYFYNGRHSIGCRFDVRYFPFDTQNCSFTFGSWCHDGSMIRYHLPAIAVTTEYHQESDIWTILSFDMNSDESKFDCCPAPFVLVNANLVIRRKSLYYIFNLILPTLVINVLSSFALFSSEGTPENRHDKLEIGITTLLSYCILLLSISDQLPKGSTSIPLLGIFYVVIMLQNALMLFGSIYMSFPQRREWITPFFANLRRKLGRRAPVVVDSSKPTSRKVVKEASNREHADEEDVGDFPERVFMLAGIISTVLITSVVFAIGLSV